VSSNEAPSIICIIVGVCVGADALLFPAGSRDGPVRDNDMCE
jgi:hypothetical protein